MHYSTLPHVNYSGQHDIRRCQAYGKLFITHWLYNVIIMQTSSFNQQESQAATGMVSNRVAVGSPDLCKCQQNKAIVIQTIWYCLEEYSSTVSKLLMQLWWTMTVEWGHVRVNRSFNNQHWMRTGCSNGIIYTSSIRQHMFFVFINNGLKHAWLKTPRHCQISITTWCRREAHVSGKTSKNSTQMGDVT